MSRVLWYHRGTKTMAAIYPEDIAGTNPLREVASVAHLMPVHWDRPGVGAKRAVYPDDCASPELESDLGYIEARPTYSRVLWFCRGTLPLTLNFDDVISSGDTPEWLPEGAIAFFDFKNGHYYFGGAEHTLNESFYEDAENWGTWTPEEVVVPGTGLVASDASEKTDAILTEAAMADLQNSATALIRMSFHLTEGKRCNASFWVSDMPEWSHGNYFEINTIPDETNHIPKVSLWNASDDDEASIPVITEGACNVAFTYAADKAVVSINGAAIISATALGDAFTSNKIHIASNAINPSSVIWESITFYAPQADAALPGLSTGD